MFRSGFSFSKIKHDVIKMVNYDVTIFFLYSTQMMVAKVFMCVYVCIVFELKHKNPKN